MITTIRTKTNSPSIKLNVRNTTNIARFSVVNKYRPKILEISTKPSAGTQRQPESKEAKPSDQEEIMDTLTTIIVKSSQPTTNSANSFRVQVKPSQGNNNRYTRRRKPTARYTPRQEPSRQEPTRQEPTRQEPSRQELTRQETTRQETTRQETARQQNTRQKVTRTYAPTYETSSVFPTNYVITKKPRVVTSEEYTASTSRPIIQTASPLTYDVQKVGSHISTQIYPDYAYDDLVTVVKAIPRQSKVLLYSSGLIQCFDQGNFPHPISCRKFISCAKMETGQVIGWEYTCPKNLSFDPIGGMCNWATEVDCRE